MKNEEKTNPHSGEWNEKSEPHSVEDQKLSDYFAASRQMRIALGGLSLAEQAILHWIFDRTYGWGKKIEAVSVRQMSIGIKDRKRQCLVAPRVAEWRTCNRAFQSLVKKGLVEIHGTDTEDKMFVSVCLNKRPEGASRIRRTRSPSENAEGGLCKNGGGALLICRLKMIEWRW